MDRIDRLMATTKPWPADAGLETSMIFHEGFDLPEFAAFVLLDDPKGREALGRWFDGFVALARAGDVEMARANAKLAAGKVKPRAV